MAKSNKAGLPSIGASARRKTAKKNPSLYGLPGENPPKYPLADKSGRPSKRYANAAKMRSAQQESMGNLTASQKKKIDNKADKVLAGKKTKEANDKKLSDYINRGR